MAPPPLKEEDLKAINEIIGEDWEAEEQEEDVEVEVEVIEGSCNESVGSGNASSNSRTSSIQSNIPKWNYSETDEQVQNDAKRLGFTEDFDKWYAERKNLQKTLPRNGKPRKDDLRARMFVMDLFEKLPDHGCQTYTCLHYRIDRRTSDESRIKFSDEEAEALADDHLSKFVQNKSQLLHIWRELKNERLMLRRLVGIKQSRECLLKLEDSNKEVWEKRLRRHTMRTGNMKANDQINLLEVWPNMIKFLNDNSFSDLSRHMDAFVDANRDVKPRKKEGRRDPEEASGIAHMTVEKISGMNKIFTGGATEAFAALVLKHKALILLSTMTGLRGISLFRLTLNKMNLKLANTESIENVDASVQPINSLRIEYPDMKNGLISGMCKMKYTMVVSNSDISACTILWLSIYTVFVYDHLGYNGHNDALKGLRQAMTLTPDGEEIPYNAENKEMLDISNYLFSSPEGNSSRIRAYLEFVMSSIGKKLGIKKFHALRALCNLILQKKKVPKDDRDSFIGWACKSISDVHYNNPILKLAESEAPAKIARNNKSAEEHSFYKVLYKLSDATFEPLLKNFDSKVNCSFLMEARKLVLLAFALHEQPNNDGEPMIKLHGLEKKFPKVTNCPQFKEFKQRCIQHFEAILREQKKRKRTLNEISEENKQLKEELNNQKVEVEKVAMLLDAERIKRQKLEDHNRRLVFELNEMKRRQQGLPADPLVMVSAAGILAQTGAENQRTQDAAPTIAIQPAAENNPHPEQALKFEVTNIKALAAADDFPDIIQHKYENTIIPLIDQINAQIPKKIALGLPKSTKEGKVVEELYKTYTLVKQYGAHHFKQRLQQARQDGTQKSWIVLARKLLADEYKSIKATT